MSKQWYTSKTLWLNAIGIIVIIAQLQFGFIIDMTVQMGVLAVINIVLRAITGEDIVWNSPED